jgi:hypothetical protein
VRAVEPYAVLGGLRRSTTDAEDRCDPFKAPQEIVPVLGADETPLRLVLGGDAVDNIRL